MRRFESEEEHKFWKTWKDAKFRCNNPNCHAYDRYGGKGIKFCDEWNEYKNFKRDMYESFIEHVKEHKKIENGKVLYDTSLDRIDSSKGYELSNCRWATRRQQELNKKNRNQFVAINLTTGKKYVYADNNAFCKANGFRRQTVSALCSGKSTRKSHHGFAFRYATPEERLTTLEEIENITIIDELKDKEN